MNPSIADWVAAIGTAGATLLAAGALAVQQRDRRRRHAELIAAWLGLSEMEPIDVWVLNRSDTPVYEVVARAMFQGHVRAVASSSVLPPGEHCLSTHEPYEGDHEDASDPPTVDFLFRDAAGRSWRRDSNGRLRRVRKGYNAMQEFIEASMAADEFNSAS